jgi:hypothetical protein
MFIPIVFLFGILFMPCAEWSIYVFMLTSIVCWVIAECKYQSLLDRVKELERKVKEGDE